YRLMRLESSLGSLHADARALDATTQRPIRRLMQHTRLALTNDERLLRLATKERLFGEDTGREHVEAFSYMMDATHRIEVNLKDMADQLALLQETVPKRLEFWAQVPVEHPAEGKLSSDFGMRNSPLDGHKKK